MGSKAAKTIVPKSCLGSRVAADPGFTLFEAMVVLVLLSLALVVVMPSFSRGMRGLELETASRDLITRMKKTRTKAITEQKVFRVVLSQDENPDQENEIRAYYVLTDEFELELQRFPLPQGVFIDPGELELPLKISFYPNGRSMGGRWALENEHGRRIRIRTDPITGFARVESRDVSDN